MLASAGPDRKADRHGRASVASGWGEPELPFRQAASLRAAAGAGRGQTILPAQARQGRIAGMAGHKAMF
jgi:hypothetical protein